MVIQDMSVNMFNDYHHYGLSLLTRSILHYLINDMELHLSWWILLYLIFTKNRQHGWKLAASEENRKIPSVKLQLHRRIFFFRYLLLAPTMSHSSCWSWSKLSVGECRGSPWMCCHFIVGLKTDNHSHSHSKLWEVYCNQLILACFWRWQEAGVNG